MLTMRHGQNLFDCFANHAEGVCIIHSAGMVYRQGEALYIIIAKMQPATDEIHAYA